MLKVSLYKNILVYGNPLHTVTSEPPHSLSDGSSVGPWSNMGHAPSKETQIQLKGLILNGVVPLNDELGRGAYGVVFTVRYV